jgi:uncharacterized protein (DUF1684 family)
MTPRSPLHSFTPAIAAAIGFALLFNTACERSEKAEGLPTNADAEAAALTEPPDDPVVAAAAWQRERDARVKEVPMSAFTAVASHYIQADSTIRIGADETVAKKDPESPMPAMAAIAYEEEAFWVEPVAGAAAPAVHGWDDDGELLPEGTPVEARRELEEGDVIAVGKFLLYASPQSGFGRIVVYDPDSPMREEFQGYRWFEPSADYQVTATFTPNPNPDEVTLGTSRGLEKTFHRAGTFAFTMGGAPQALVALAASPSPEPGDELFMPFRDETTGKETYDVGRYLSVEYEGAGQEHLLDFNRATNPLCNYSPHFNCPFPPEENNLKVAIRAGEMAYPKH